MEIVSPADYLERERTSEVRHEYVDGYLYAMTGASSTHGKLAIRFASTFENGLPGKCSVYVADMKVLIKTEQSQRYYYPDVVVTCEKQEPQSHVCNEPLVLVEVLSPSTQRADRDEKFEQYKLIDSFAEYVLVRQDVPRVEVFRRKNSWRRESYFIEDKFTLDAVELEFSVEDLYRRVDFSND